MPTRHVACTFAAIIGSCAGLKRLRIKDPHDSSTLQLTNQELTSVLYVFCCTCRAIGMVYQFETNTNMQSKTKLLICAHCTGSNEHCQAHTLEQHSHADTT